MAKRSARTDTTPCLWINGPQAFKEFATHKGKTQSARHIKPLHWYIACRLVIEGGSDLAILRRVLRFGSRKKGVRKAAPVAFCITIPPRVSPESRWSWADSRPRT
jgi:hypothetical protein